MTVTTRQLTAADLTPARRGLILDMIAGYTGMDDLICLVRSQISKGKPVDDEDLLDIVNTERPIPAPAPVVKDGTYTIVNPKTGGYRTLRITSDTSWMSTPPPAGTRIAQYLMGPDNETSFKGFGFIAPTGEVRVWKSSQAESAVVAALTWLLKNGAGREAELGKAYAVRSGRCCFCNRKLTTPGSVHYGYGPDCADRNDLPWGANPGYNAVTEAQAVVDSIGFQKVAVNGATITHANGSTTSTATAPRHVRTYEELFGQD